MIVDHVLFVLEDYESKYNKDKGHIPQTVVIKVSNPNDGLHSRRRSVTAVALDGRVDATLDEMDAAAWTAISLLAATSLGVAVLSRFSHRRARRTDQSRRGRVDAMSGRLDALAARFDAQ